MATYKVTLLVDMDDLDVGDLDAVRDAVIDAEPEVIGCVEADACERCATPLAGAALFGFEGRVYCGPCVREVAK